MGRKDSPKGGVGTARDTDEDETAPLPTHASQVPVVRLESVWNRQGRQGAERLRRIGKARQGRQQRAQWRRAKYARQLRRQAGDSREEEAAGKVPDTAAAAALDARGGGRSVRRRDPFAKALRKRAAIEAERQRRAEERARQQRERELARQRRERERRERMLRTPRGQPILQYRVQSLLENVERQLAQGSAQCGRCPAGGRKAVTKASSERLASCAHGRREGRSTTRHRAPLRCAT